MSQFSIMNNKKGHNIVNDKIADSLFVVSISQELIANKVMKTSEVNTNAAYIEC